MAASPCQLLERCLRVGPEASKRASGRRARLMNVPHLDARVDPCLCAALRCLEAEPLAVIEVAAGCVLVARVAHALEVVLLVPLGAGGHHVDVEQVPADDYVVHTGPA